MKRQLTVALGLAVVATPAFATKARLEALGEDNFGSYYINDNRNIFLNPARITENKDFITYEFGDSGANIGAADSATAPRATGGFAKSHGNMVYGLHFGDSSPSTGQLRAVTGANLQERQPWDLHVGGDAGMKWGASLTYENFSQGGVGSTNRVSSEGLRLRAGTIMGDLDVFAHVSLANNANNYRGSSIEGDMGLFLGAGYMLNNYKLFADYRQIGAEYRGATTAAGAKEDISTSIIRVGAARQERLNDRATLFAKAMVIRTNVEDDGGATLTSLGTASTDGADVEGYVAPLTLGLEYAATSWLDLRASVVQNVWSKQEIDAKTTGAKKFSQNVADTSIRAGASLKFGEFSVDGLISTGGNGGDATGIDTSAGNGNLRTDNLMSRVSMIYRF